MSQIATSVSILKNVRNVLCLSLTVFSLSCKEPLPPHEDPRNVFDGTIDAEYVYAPDDNSLKIRFAIKNKFDETLQGKASLTGSIQISLRRIPDRKRTFSLSSANLIQARNYNPNSRELTIDPGDSIRLAVSWNFVDDKGIDLRQGVFQYVIDPTCPTYRRIALREILIVKANLTVFDRTEDVNVGPVIVPICHINAWVDTRICPLILPKDACVTIQQ